MSEIKMRNLLGILIPFLCLAAIPAPVQAAKSHKVVQATKERLVLMPLRVTEEDKSLQGAMETALVQGLQQKYEVFSGEQVSQKAKEIFNKESHSTKKECDETRCMQGIAEAFQAELIATANVTKRDGGYFLALSIQNIFDNKVVYSNSVPCKNCDSFQVVDKLKELSGTRLQATPSPSAAYNEAPSVSGKTIDPESALWGEVQKGNSVDDYGAYLAQYPKGKYVALAKSRVKKLQDEVATEEGRKEQQAWQAAEQGGSETNYQSYLKDYPQGRYAGLVQARIKKLQADQAAREEQELWKEAQASDNARTVQSYLDKYPVGSYVAAAQGKLRELAARQEQEAWLAVQTSDDAKTVQSFLDKYPNSSNIAAAQEKLTAIKAAIAGPFAFLDGDWKCLMKDVTTYKNVTTYKEHFTVRGNQVKASAVDLGFSAVYTAQITGDQLVLSGKSTSNPKYGEIIEKTKVLSDRSIHKYFNQFNGGSHDVNIDCQKDE